MDNINQIAEEKTKELLDNLAVKYSQINVEPLTEENILKIGIQGPDLGILIGFHGRNIDALKTILSLILNKDNPKDAGIRVMVNINDYSEKREEQLKSMILNAKNVMETNSKEIYSFPPMNSADRRTIHTLAAQMGLQTQSDGEGNNRHVSLIK